MSANRGPFATQGDLAREQVKRRGLLWFGEVASRVDAWLGTALPVSRRAFALACATRLLEASDPEEGSLAETWSGWLDELWLALSDARTAPAIATRVRKALAHADALVEQREAADEDDEELDELDSDPVSAALCAARCFIDGDAESASSAASLAVDAAFGVAIEELGLDPNDFAWDPAAEPAMPLARENMHPRVQGELRRQLEDLALLDERGATPETFRALRLRGAQP